MEQRRGDQALSIGDHRGFLSVTTGDPAFTGTALYHAYSFLRLDSGTLALRGTWRLTLGQAADLDFGSSPTFFDGTVQGVSTALVGACNKNGRYYALRRNSLHSGPVWSVRVGAAAHTSRGMCLASAVWTPRPSSCTWRVTPRASTGKPSTGPSGR